MFQAAGQEGSGSKELSEETGNSEMKKDLRRWGEEAEETAAELW